MAKKRLKIKDKQGNVVDYDISSASVTIDIEGKSLDVKLSEIATALLQAVTEVTFNGTPYNRENGKINLGQQMQADWNENNTNWPAYIRNKPNSVVNEMLYDQQSRKVRQRRNGVVEDVFTLPEEGSQVTFDEQMSSTSENGVQNKVIKAYVDAVSQRIDTLLGSGNVQGAIDTFNEVVAFLNGIDTSDPTLANQLLALNNAIANSGKVKSVTINGTKKTPDAQTGDVDLDTIIKGDDGKNAFELAQQNGYTGTLEQWLQSMAENAGFSYTEDSTTIYVQDALHYDPSPRISVNPTEINLSPEVGGTVTKTIVIKGFNLTSPIAIAISDSSGFYSIDKQTLPTSGGSVVLTYHPTAAGTHSASLLISSGSDADVAVGVKGIAATPTINVDKQSLSLKGESGTPVTASFHVTGVSLTDVINVAVNGNGFTVSPNLITINQAANGIDVVVTFDGSADSGNATISLTSTGATNVQVTAEYTAIGRLAVGDTITSYPGFVFTVLDGQETVSVKGSGASGDVVIPSSVLDSNGLSYDVTTMDYKAFFGMSGITSVDVPSSIVMWLGGEGGYKGYSQAFFNCTNLVSATLSLKGETRTGVFTNCSSLRNVTLRDDSDTIPEDCFVGCKALESLVIPDNVSVIGNGAFERSGIKRIQIGTSDKCKCNTFGSALYGGSTNGAMSLEYIICYSLSIPTAQLYSRMQYGGGLPYGFRNYDSTDQAKGSNFDTNGSGRVYVPRSVLNGYRTNPTDGSSANGNIFLRVNDINDSTGASGRIYAIEDIGTISGHENDALLTD